MSIRSGRKSPEKTLRLAVVVGAVVLAPVASCRPARAETVAAGDWTRLELLTAEPMLTPRADVRLAGVPPAAEVKLDLGADPWPGSVRREGGVVVLTPRSELPGGVHRLRLYEHLPDGNIEERANWRLEVAGDAPGRRGSLGLEADLDAGWRVADQGLEDPPERFQSSGSARLFARFGGGEGWRLDAEASAVHNSRFAGVAGIDRVDVGTALLVAGTGPLELAAGDQGVGPLLGESLVLARLYRRGVTAELDFDAAGWRLSGFTVSTRPVVGSEVGLGIGDADGRIAGAQMGQRILDSPAARLDAAVVYLRGGGSTTAGVGVSGPAASSAAAGEAWAGAVAARLFAERLRLEGEWAESRFDPDGDAGGARRHRDGAFSLAATWSSWGSGVRRPFAWQVGVSRQHVGANFRSLANPALLNGRDTLAGSGRLAWPRFDLQLDLRREEDEVGGRPESARAETAALAVTYDRGPRPRGEERGWLAPQGVSLSWYQSGEEALSPADAAAAVDRSSRTLRAAVHGGAWSLSYTHDRFEDDIHRAAGSSHRFFDAGTSCFGERWSLRSTLQWARFEGFGGERTTVLARLSGERTLVPDKLSGSLAVDVVQIDEDGTEEQVPSLSGELTWQLYRSRPGWPGAALWLRGNYTRDGDGEPTFSLRAGQLFLGARLSWRRSF